MRNIYIIFLLMLTGCSDQDASEEENESFENRSHSNNPVDINNPENLKTLEAYLEREQYGDWPIINGTDSISYEDDSIRQTFFPRMYMTDSTSGREEWKNYKNE